MGGGRDDQPATADALNGINGRKRFHCFNVGCASTRCKRGGRGHVTNRSARLGLIYPINTSLGVTSFSFKPFFIGDSARPVCWAFRCRGQNTLHGQEEGPPQHPCAREKESQGAPLATPNPDVRRRQKYAGELRSFLLAEIEEKGPRRMPWPGSLRQRGRENARARQTTPIARGRSGSAVWQEIGGGTPPLHEAAAFGAAEAPLATRGEGKCAATKFMQNSGCLFLASLREGALTSEAGTDPS
jgi:hypothetical protein